MLVFVRSSVNDTFAETTVRRCLHLLAQFTLMSESYSDSLFADAELGYSNSTPAAVVELADAARCLSCILLSNDRCSLSTNFLNQCIPAFAA